MRVKAAPFPWQVKVAKPAAGGQGTYTGVAYGKYFLNGKIVSREEYLASRPNKQGKPGKGERAQAKAGLPPPLPSRHNPDLDAAMGAPARHHTPALNALVSQDSRHNPDLDAAMGMGPAKPAARDTSHIGRDLFAERAGLSGVAASAPAQSTVAATPSPPGQGGGMDPAALVDRAMTQPPPLPHHRTHATALGAANKLVAAARDGKSPRHVHQAHMDAVLALHEHEREGHKAIDRMARDKYGDSAKGRFLAAKAKREFGQKMTAARQRLAKVAGQHGVRTGRIVKGFDSFTIDLDTLLQVADLEN